MNVKLKILLLIAGAVLPAIAQPVSIGVKGGVPITDAFDNSWEFPALAKFAVLPGPIRPFVDAGGALRHISGIDQLRRTVNAGLAPVNVELNTATEFKKRNDVGLVFGGGVEFKLGHLRITPELRYTRWGSENFRDPVNALLRTNHNQGDFLLGLTF